LPDLYNQLLLIPNSQLFLTCNINCKFGNFILQYFCNSFTEKRGGDGLDFSNLKYLVVGSGVFGATIGERIAHDLNERVVVIEKRNHIGGNCFSAKDAQNNIECHHYGSHIFHTSNETVWHYIQNFCELNNYKHRVLTQYQNKTYQMPVNLSTINAFYQINLRPFEVPDFLAKELAKECYIEPKNLEEKSISLIGRRLYEAFIKGYTQKQWDKDPRLLPPEIINRLPVRYNYNDEYFNDKWQGIPVDGFGQMITAMLQHPNIETHLNVDFFNIKDLIPKDCLVIYSGPIDCFFNYQFGHLEWRSLSFEMKTLDVADFQGVAVMNYAETAVPYTRIHEFKHFTPERIFSPEQTIICMEYPKGVTSKDEPYYPVNTTENQKIYQQYVTASRLLDNVIFGGRLGTYAYLDMDRAIESALALYQTKIKESTK
jgi:UDP-galactopyranose mutase